MGLDLYLNDKNIDVKAIRSKLSKLYEKRRSIQDEIDRLEEYEGDAQLASENITHNLTAMAEEAGLYEVFWHPERRDITSAAEMIGPIEQGLAKLESDPAYYKSFNSPNGWGTYDDFVGFTRSVLGKCKEFPDAVVVASI